MAFSRLVFGLLVLSVAQSYASELAFLWGDLAHSNYVDNPSPLNTLNAAGFSSLLKKQLAENPFVVCFIEQTLSPEDLSRRDSKGHSSFPYLEANLDNSVYIPSVENPLRVLKKLAPPEKVNHVKFTENGLSAEIEDGNQFLFISLKDAREGESRTELLKRHNDFMEDMFTRLKKQYGDVVAIYTSHYPSWTVAKSRSHYRGRRQAQEDNGVWMLDNLRMNVSAIYLNDGSSITDLKSLGLQSSSTSQNGSTLNTTLVFPNTKVTLNFISQSGYWLFNTITLTQDSPSVTEELRSQGEVYSNLGWSYRCKENVTFSTVNDTRSYKITFQNLKIQPYFGNATNGTETFGESFNCVGFFSTPIWAGLFVVFILLIIMFYGIIMMMEINTMDRFDDPKGKTITISATE